MTSKGKILMLHGFVQSDRIFSGKTGGLRKNLKKLGYELYYANGPEIVDKSTLPGGDDNKTTEMLIADAKSDDLYGWWLRKTSGPQALMNYEIQQSTFDYLHDYIVENGPFDGVIGFSQGAGLGGYIVQDIRNILNLTEEQQPDLKFFISFSGFKLIPDIYQEPYTLNHAPSSLHVIGEMDAVVSEERTMQLFNEWADDKRVLLKHAGSHFIPNSKPFAMQVCNWIKITTEEETKKNKETAEITKNSKKSADPGSLEDDLMNMMDSIGKL
ncbi:similar to Saccharomyces cerevisiae YOR280C FSH3 Putative serine hydrolase [Maudiozyma barnettii]|uniref:Similar to Saccharomyces cerevisiae YOR280C FSH3 Putative serine hydrolase n=1 Tax=Maudiozyma barnettii TaxID=61262 RepID=A0A8H2VCV4_9SACH|nr:putative serine hydrolase [Kazachstania barnettii]CAB4252914.1 similar to Saccharomyces cerevisiae YOR280C FSH3 Putative serine hydrolase [Kazachstania barnettii]CAD1780709.1 similar to Saccharomyces cerevisiae YOR280C FSH3 Putative serine hydrolase [Kazachstania barnettii]